jgi:predicted outer membrane repeat protein
VTLEHCVVTQNNASAGGGLNNFGSMTLINSSVSENVADGSGEFYTKCGTGGGIKLEQGPLVVINSTVSGNSSRGNGGGIFVACKGTLELTNSTVSGNDATGGSGGGVCVRGVARVTQSTIANNRAAQTGGGIYVRGSGESGLVRGWLDFSNTIVAGNTTGSQYCCADCMLGEHSTLGLNANNLVEDGSCSPAYTGSPLLQPLADNGGHILTHALLPDSPAIDAISSISCTLNLDQRGMRRPMEVSSMSTPCDIGAFELQPDER